MYLPITSYFMHPTHQKQADILRLFGNNEIYMIVFKEFGAQAS